MAAEHYKACRALDYIPIVCGRGEQSASAFECTTGHRPLTGDLPDQLASLPSIPRRAIVAANVTELGKVTRILLDAGIPYILLEKPGGPTLGEIESLAASDPGGCIRMAYNRRFFPSALTARKIVAEDGGITSMLIEFNENRPLVAAIEKHGSDVKKNWFLANSTHVADLAFFVAGYPANIPTHPMTSEICGDPDAHPPKESYAGVGRLDDAVYAWHADWRSAGRWGVELCTPRRRLIMKPLEQLHQMAAGSFAMTPVPLEFAEPESTKPGLCNMISRFMTTPDDPDILTMSSQVDRLQTFKRLVGK